MLDLIITFFDTTVLSSWPRNPLCRVQVTPPETGKKEDEGHSEGLSVRNKYSIRA